MRLQKILTALLGVALSLALAAVSPAASAPDFVALAQKCKPAVVNISIAKNIKPRVMPPRQRGNEFFDEFFERFFNEQNRAPRKQRSLGSGFIISPDGYILTNNHVVDGADEVKVTLADGRDFDATVEGADKKLDLALLKIKAGGDLPSAPLGDSDGIRVGEWVMAIGNPFGLEQTVTAGIVSAKGRVIGAGPYDDFIQTDASINPGNSGGPLFNAAGEVVGINTAIIAGGQGIGFATPVNAARSILPQLKSVGHVTRGWLGVTIQQMSDELATSFGLDKARGALVTDVVEDSPAAKAGIERGDVIVSFDGREIDEMHDLPRLVAVAGVDKLVKLEILRDGRRRTVKVKVGILDDETAASGDRSLRDSDWTELGLELTNVTAELAGRYELENDRGVLVTSINPDSLAAESDLRVGDLIVEVNGRSIENLGSFHDAVEANRGKRHLRLLVDRQGSLLYTVLRLKE
jgi:serine protease Do